MLAKPLFRIPKAFRSGAYTSPAKAYEMAQLNRKVLGAGNGIAIPTGATTYLEPGVQYMVDTSKRTNPATGVSKAGPLHVVGFEKVPMGDWDWVDPVGHPNPDSITIENLGDVHERLTRYTTDNPESRWSMYITPGGVRAYEMSKQTTPKQFYGSGGIEGSSVLEVDPFYSQYSTRAKKSPYSSSGYAPPSFRARLSGKPLRENDFVAYYVGDVGEGNIHPYNQRLVTGYHDRGIQRALAASGLNPHSPALELLNKHLGTTPPAFADKVEQRLSGLGLI